MANLEEGLQVLLLRAKTKHLEMTFTVVYDAYDKGHRHVILDDSNLVYHNYYLKHAWSRMSCFQ